MTWPYWLVGTFGWLGVWMLLGTRVTAFAAEPTTLGRMRSVAIAFVVSTCIVLFATRSRAADFYLLTLWVHHAAVGALFVFLVAAQFFQAEALWKIHAKLPAMEVAASYRRLNAITAVVPAPAALLIFLSGLRLIFELPVQNSPSSVWLCLLIVSFGFFFWDGLLFFAPTVEQIYEHWCDAGRTDGQGNGLPLRPTRGESAQLLFHFVSFPLVFLLGVFRWSPLGSLTAAIRKIEHVLSFLPFGWPQVVTAILLWASMGLLVGGLTLLRRRSRDNT